MEAPSAELLALRGAAAAKDNQPRVNVASDNLSPSPPSAAGMERVHTTVGLQALRELMQKENVDVYIVPSEDSHASEYIAKCDARREFISGFSGSAGTAVVTLDQAALATDGRYFNQAGQQLDTNWELLKSGMEGVLTWQEWAAEKSAGGKTVAIDPMLISGSAADKLNESIKKAGGAGLRSLDANLVDLVWGPGRPARPAGLVKVLGPQFAGKDVKTKLANLRTGLDKKKAAGFVVSSLDEIAWLFNLRGSDIDYNPVFYSYAIVTPDTAVVYVDASKLTSEAASSLAENEVAVKPYGAFFDDERALAAAAQKEKGANSAAEVNKTRKFLISDDASWALKLSLGGGEFVDAVRSPVMVAKAVKNNTELDGMRRCHVRDGAALCEYFAWLEDQLVNKKAELDEVEAADKLEEIRSKKENFAGLSFPTISASGPNGAVIHYEPHKDTCARVDADAMYLCDSGAQYYDGTTDTTRTLHFGTPSEAERRKYTLVLKGHIALHDAVFPKGTTGHLLDGFARAALWREGLDYRHGTGHGVGSFLNVHEGPVGIGTRKEYAETSLSPGQVTSIEPGYYEDGRFGIRIENVAIVVPRDTEEHFGDRPFLGFEPVTMVPYCRKLIVPGLFTPEERAWINKYYADMYEKLEPFFREDALTADWLRRETALF